MELQTCRPIGMTVGPIPWTAIQAYVAAKGIADAERFEKLVREMDVAYLGAHYKRTEGVADG